MASECANPGTEISMKFLESSLESKRDATGRLLAHMAQGTDLRSTEASRFLESVENELQGVGEVLVAAEYAVSRCNQENVELRNSIDTILLNYEKLKGEHRDLMDTNIELRATIFSMNQLRGHGANVVSLRSLREQLHTNCEVHIEVLSETKELVNLILGIGPQEICGREPSNGDLTGELDTIVDFDTVARIEAAPADTKTKKLGAYRLQHEMFYELEVCKVIVLKLREEIMMIENETAAEMINRCATNEKLCVRVSDCEHMNVTQERQAFAITEPNAAWDKTSDERSETCIDCPLSLLAQEVAAIEHVMESLQIALEQGHRDYCAMEEENDRLNAEIFDLRATCEAKDSVHNEILRAQIHEKSAFSLHEVDCEKDIVCEIVKAVQQAEDDEYCATMAAAQIATYLDELAGPSVLSNIEALLADADLMAKIAMRDMCHSQSTDSQLQQEIAATTGNIQDKEASVLQEPMRSTHGMVDVTKTDAEFDAFEVGSVLPSRGTELDQCAAFGLTDAILKYAKEIDSLELVMNGLQAALEHGHREFCEMQMENERLTTELSERSGKEITSEQTLRLPDERMGIQLFTIAEKYQDELRETLDIVQELGRYSAKFEIEHHEDGNAIVIKLVDDLALLLAKAELAAAISMQEKGSLASELEAERVKLSQLQHKLQEQSGTGVSTTRLETIGIQVGQLPDRQSDDTNKDNFMLQEPGLPQKNMLDTVESELVTQTTILCEKRIQELEHSINKILAIQQQKGHPKLKEIAEKDKCEFNLRQLRNLAWDSSDLLTATKEVLQVICDDYCSIACNSWSKFSNDLDAFCDHEIFSNIEGALETLQNMSSVSTQYVKMHIDAKNCAKIQTNGESAMVCTFPESAQALGRCEAGIQTQVQGIHNLFDGGEEVGDFSTITLTEMPQSFALWKLDRELACVGDFLVSQAVIGCENRVLSAERCLDKLNVTKQQQSCICNGIMEENIRLRCALAERADDLKSFQDFAGILDDLIASQEMSSLESLLAAATSEASRCMLSKFQLVKDLETSKVTVLHLRQCIERLENQAISTAISLESASSFLTDVLSGLHEQVSRLENTVAVLRITRDDVCLNATLIASEKSQHIENAARYMELLRETQDCVHEAVITVSQGRENEQGSAESSLLKAAITSLSDISVLDDATSIMVEAERAAVRSADTIAKQLMDLDLFNRRILKLEKSIAESNTGITPEAAMLTVELSKHAEPCGALPQVGLDLTIVGQGTMGAQVLESHQNPSLPQGMKYSNDLNTSTGQSMPAQNQIWQSESASEPSQPSSLRADQECPARIEETIALEWTAHVEQESSVSHLSHIQLGPTQDPDSAASDNNNCLVNLNGLRSEHNQESILKMVEMLQESRDLIQKIRGSMPNLDDSVLNEAMVSLQRFTNVAGTAATSGVRSIADVIRTEDEAGYLPPDLRGRSSYFGQDVVIASLCFHIRTLESRLLDLSAAASENIGYKQSKGVQASDSVETLTPADAIGCETVTAKNGSKLADSHSVDSQPFENFSIRSERSRARHKKTAVATRCGKGVKIWEDIVNADHGPAPCYHPEDPKQFMQLFNSQNDADMNDDLSAAVRSEATASATGRLRGALDFSRSMPTRFNNDWASSVSNQARTFRTNQERQTRAAGPKGANTDNTRGCVTVSSEPASHESCGDKKAAQRRRTAAVYAAPTRPVSRGSADPIIYGTGLPEAGHDWRRIPSVGSDRRLLEQLERAWQERGADFHTRIQVDQRNDLPARSGRPKSASTSAGGKVMFGNRSRALQAVE